MAHERSEQQKVRTDQIRYGLVSQVRELGPYPKCNEEPLKGKIMLVPLSRVARLKEQNSLSEDAVDTEKDGFEGELGGRITGLEDWLVIENKKEKSQGFFSGFGFEQPMDSATRCRGYNWLGWERFWCQLKYTEWGPWPSQGEMSRKCLGIGTEDLGEISERQVVN